MPGAGRRRWLVAWRSGRSSQWFGTLGLGFAALYLLPVSESTSLAGFAGIGLLTAIALMVGPWLHAASPVRPWRLLAVASVLFIVGAVMRPVAVTLTGAGQALADAFTLPGYLTMIASFVTLLRARRSGVSDGQAMVDNVIVGVGAAMLTFTLLAFPAASLPGRPVWLSLTSGLYPLFDVVILLVLLHLWFTTAVRQAALVLLITAFGFMLVGDLGYAYIGTQGRLTGSRLMDAPFLLTFVLVGSAVLHPSMALIAKARRRPVQAWSPTRLAVLTPALMTGPLLVALRPPVTWQERMLYGLSVALLVALLVVRALGAVSSATRIHRALQSRATHDALTGLGNRTLVLEQLERMVAGASAVRGAVHLVFLDLDRFKLVNDSWGHDTGDELLRQVGARLSGCFRTGDLVARLGGDEFVVACRSDLRDSSGHDIATRILAALAQPFALSQASDVIITPSIGIASYHAGQAPVSAEDLIRDADTAMYEAKAAGRGRIVHFDTSMRDSVRTRVETEIALRLALERGQFRLHYQPVVDLARQQVEGYEALLRWEHPALGHRSPDEFIPVAEETGLIVPIGAWVLEEAVAQLGAWLETDPEVSVAVNVSPRQLRDPQFVDRVAQTLSAAGVPASRLIIEITESVVIEDPDATIAVLGRLRALGVRLALDDFGTGYSALGLLRKLPVHVVKVDRGFVEGIGTDPDDEEIVRAIVAMAHALQLSVVAEGVETERQREMLAALGVESAQGWLFGHPLPPSQARPPRPTAGVVDAPVDEQDDEARVPA